MADKSPRQTKKVGKSIKEKRAAKRAEASEQLISEELTRRRKR